MYRIIKKIHFALLRAVEVLTSQFYNRGVAMKERIDAGIDQ